MLLFATKQGGAGKQIYRRLFQGWSALAMRTARKLPPPPQKSIYRFSVRELPPNFERGCEFVRVGIGRTRLALFPWIRVLEVSFSRRNGEKLVGQATDLNQA